jgi:hypothetical protein
LIDHVNVFNNGSQPVKVIIKNGSFLDGTASFVDVDSEYTVEIDSQASGYIFAGNQIGCGFVASGQNHQEHILNNTDFFQNDIGTLLLGDGVTQPGISIEAEVIGTGSAEVYASVNWKELKQ